MAELEALVSSLIELDEERTLSIAGDLLQREETSPDIVMSACQQAMRVIGERYERHDYYLAGLILAGEIFSGVLALIQPDQDRPQVQSGTGTVVLGTVHGDIHNIGKNMFASTLRGSGFTVIDLGVDVPKERFLESVLATRPDVLCLSGLITTAFHSMRATVELIRSHADELGVLPPVILGGGTVNDQVCRYVAADSWSNDAMEGVRICLRLCAASKTVRSPLGGCC